MLACRQWSLGHQCDYMVGSWGTCITLLPPPRTHLSALELPPCQAKLSRPYWCGSLVAPYCAEPSWVILS